MCGYNPLHTSTPKSYWKQDAKVLRSMYLCVGCRYTVSLWSILPQEERLPWSSMLSRGKQIRLNTGYSSPVGGSALLTDPATLLKFSSQLLSLYETILCFHSVNSFIICLLNFLPEFYQRENTAVISTQWVLLDLLAKEGTKPFSPAGWLHTPYGWSFDMFYALNKWSLLPAISLLLGLFQLCVVYLGKKL